MSILVQISRLTLLLVKIIMYQLPNLAISIFLILSPNFFLHLIENSKCFLRIKAEISSNIFQYFVTNWLAKEIPIINNKPKAYNHQKVLLLVRSLTEFVLIHFSFQLTVFIKFSTTSSLDFDFKPIKLFFCVIKVRFLLRK